MFDVPTLTRLSATMYFAWLTRLHPGNWAAGPAVAFQPGSSNSRTSNDPVQTGGGAHSDPWSGRWQTAAFWQTTATAPKYCT